MREIESETVGLDNRSGLMHMLAKDNSKRRLQEVGSSMRALDGFATIDIHLGLDRVARFQFRRISGCFGGIDFMHDDLADKLSVDHVELTDLMIELEADFPLSPVCSPFSA